MRATGTFSGKPKRSSGYRIQMLNGNHMVEIDAIYQASAKQFSIWLKRTFGKDIDPQTNLSEKDRLNLIAECSSDSHTADTPPAPPEPNGLPEAP